MTKQNVSTSAAVLELDNVGVRGNSALGKKVLAAVFAVVLASVIIGAVGFAPGYAHTAAHDTRHVMVFPCH